MTQKIEDSVWQDFKKEKKKVEKIKDVKIIFPDNINHKEFWDKFLSEEFPAGSINNTLEKNLAVWIIQNKLDIQEIKTQYVVQGWNPNSLLGWIKRVSAGEILEYNVGELVNWGKKFKPELIDLLEKKGKVKSKEKIIFNYETIQPQQDIKTLKQLEEIIKLNFPAIWFETKACLSIVCSLALKNLNGCPALNLVGNPAGEKTTILSFFYGCEETYLSDDFTPRAFVSHSANVPKVSLEDVDLLPKLKNKVLLTPELAPLFEAQKDKLLDNFAILTRVLDGEGLNRDSGAHGHRGYSGDYKFCWLGATTPLRSSVWNIMGKIGNRLFFLNMRDKNRTDDDYLKMFTEEEYEEKIKICRGAVRSFLNNFFKKHLVRSFKWNNQQQDIFVLREIIKYAKLLSKLRGTLMAWKGREEGKYEYTFPIIEEPPRAINSLRNIARGHALINNRDYLHSDDLEIVKAVCLSSMPHDRYKFFQLLQKHEGRLSSEIIEKELSCSDETARKTMKIFEVLGVVDIKDLSIGVGRPMKFIEIKPEFQDLIKTQTQVGNGLENSKGVNHLQGINHSQGINHLENLKPSKTQPASDDNLNISYEKV